MWLSTSTRKCTQNSFSRIHVKPVFDTYITSIRYNSNMTIIKGTMTKIKLFFVLDSPKSMCYMPSTTSRKFGVWFSFRLLVVISHLLAICHLRFRLLLSLPWGFLSEAFIFLRESGFYTPTKSALTIISFSPSLYRYCEYFLFKISKI